jgi:hypothetical protein
MSTKTCYSRFENLEKYSVRGFKLDAVPQKFTATDRGKLFFIEGGTGKADEVYVCIKGTDGKLALKKVTLT